MIRSILFIVSFVSSLIAYAQQDVVYELIEDSSQVYAFTITGEKIEGFMVSDTHFRVFTGKRLSEYNISLFDAFTNEPLDYLLPETISDKTNTQIGFKRYSDSSLTSVSEASESPKGKFEVDLLLPNQISGSKVLFDTLSKAIINGREFSNGDVKSLYAAASEGFKNQYLNSNRELYAQFGNDCFACNWEKKFMLSPLFFNSEYISLNITEYAYTGGAHGMLHNSIININQATGNIITLDSLVKNDSLEKLTGIITSHIARNKGIQQGTSLKEAGFFMKSIPPAKNFAVTPHGLYFIYNPYEIAPYSMGIITVFIPEKELKGILTKKL